eukprot:gb/GECH01005847.1/.p1 GENE.gb/GECH01005847.1/~~gb/GECH01005847.1/.p1  ORF type:complete len:689 (+),score=159.17 gb/GECH01005847.1/:1-2067(+)
MTHNRSSTSTSTLRQKLDEKRKRKKEIRQLSVKYSHAEFPEEIILQIFLFIPFRSLFKCFRLNKHWNTLYDNETFWRERFEYDTLYRVVYFSPESSWRERCLRAYQQINSFQHWKEGSADIKVFPLPYSSSNHYSRASSASFSSPFESIQNSSFRLSSLHDHYQQNQNQLNSKHSDLFKDKEPLRVDYEDGLVEVNESFFVWLNPHETKMINIMSLDTGQRQSPVIQGHSVSQIKLLGWPYENDLLVACKDGYISRWRLSAKTRSKSGQAECIRMYSLNSKRRIVNWGTLEVDPTQQYLATTVNGTWIAIWDLTLTLKIDDSVSIKENNSRVNEEHLNSNSLNESSHSANSRFLSSQRKNSSAKSSTKSWNSKVASKKKTEAIKKSHSFPPLYLLKEMGNIGLWVKWTIFTTNMKESLPILLGVCQSERNPMGSTLGAFPVYLSNDSSWKYIDVPYRINSIDTRQDSDNKVNLWTQLSSFRVFRLDIIFQIFQNEEISSSKRKKKKEHSQGFSNLSIKEIKSILNLRSSTGIRTCGVIAGGPKIVCCGLSRNRGIESVEMILNNRGTEKYVGVYHTTEPIIRMETIPGGKALIMVVTASDVVVLNMKKKLSREYILYQRHGMELVKLVRNDLLITASKDHICVWNFGLGKQKNPGDFPHDIQILTPSGKDESEDTVAQVLYQIPWKND